MPTRKKDGVRLKAAPQTSHKKMIPGETEMMVTVQMAEPKAPNPKGNPHLKDYALAGSLAAIESGARTPRYAKVLADLIRQLGEEVIDPTTGWTRVVSVIKRLYLNAMAGDTRAAALLFERGWGKVPAPVQMNVRAELIHVITESGLTLTEAWQDPTLRDLLEAQGLHVDANNLPQLISPKETLP